jgi:hypothetical protein
MTYGKFIDAMTEAAKMSTEAEYILKGWMTPAINEQWEEHRSMPLEEGEVLSFAEGITTALRQALTHACTFELHGQRLRDAHTFLQAIHAKLVELGIEVELDRIDVPLTPAESGRSEFS